MTIEELKVYRKAKKQSTKIGMPVILIWFAVMATALFLVSKAIPQSFSFSGFITTIANSTQQSPAFTIVVTGDLHAGDASSFTTDFTNTVNTIITNKSAWNVKMFISPGDTYEQTTNVNAWFASNGGVIMTNALYQLKAAGISVLISQGNHDSDFAMSNYVENSASTNSIQWFTNVYQNFLSSDAKFYQSYAANDCRNIAYTMTVGSFNLLVISLGWIDNYNTNGFNNPSFSTTNQTITAYTPTVLWASNLIATMPTYKAIVCAHYIVDTNGNPNFKDWSASPDVPDPNSGLGGGNYVCEGPGLTLWTAVQGLPNIIGFICGHVRKTTEVINTLTANDGHSVFVCKFNTQTGILNDPNLAAQNGGVFAALTFYPAIKQMMVKNYGKVLTNSTSTWGARFLNNNEFVNQPLINQWTYNWQ